MPSLSICYFIIHFKLKPQLLANGSAIAFLLFL